MNDEYEYEPTSIEEVFEREKIDHHVLEQRGLDLVCTSCPASHAQVRFFKSGQVLGQDEDGNYKILGVEDDAKARLR